MLDFHLQLIFKKLPSVIAPLCHYTLVSAPYPHSLKKNIYICITKALKKTYITKGKVFIK